MDATGNVERIKGDWVPPKLIEPDFHPLFMWPPKPKAIVQHIFGWEGYLFPRPIIYFALSFITWRFLQPGPDVAGELSWNWIWPILVRNALLITAINSFWHVMLYVFKIQDTQFKYNRRWPGGDNPSFFMRSQILDNLFYTYVWSVPILTAWEVFALWMQASGRSPVVSWQDQPIYLGVLLFLVPLWHTVHFHAAHWTLHRGPFYTFVHSVHHRNVNFTPWAAFALHPLESFLFFSPVWLFLVIPSHPLIAITCIQFAMFTATPSHLGFGRVVTLPDGRSVNMDHYHHYLHHRYHECNYSGTDLDVWFGTWHDGSKVAHEAMKDRIKRRNINR